MRGDSPCQFPCSRDKHANSANEFFDNDPLILLDGVPVFDIDRLLAIDPLKVRKLDMIHRKYFLGGTRTGLSIIDALTNTWIATIPTGQGAHSVAADR